MREYKSHTFKIGAGSTTTKEGRWFEGEPIWVTAEKQGIKTATYFWPGSDAEIQGVRPTYRKIYDNSIPYTNRIEQVGDWLALPSDQRPQLITLYFESPDKEGHLYGPNSEEVRTAVQTMDSYLGQLLKKLDDIGVRNQTNILVLSDHGMAQLSRKRVIFLDDYINLNEVDLINWSPVADIVPKDDPKKIYDMLKGVHPNLTPFLKDSVPPELHYQNHRRIAPVFAVADIGWTITSHQIFENNPRSFLGGTHGYQPDQQEMWAIFLASGPAFKKKVRMDAFKNIHVYELMCHLLNIEPASNDGKSDVFNEILF